MPVRGFGYDGADYRYEMVQRDEILRRNREEKRNDPVLEPYPVVTLVLYFGLEHWNYDTTLKKVLSYPKELDSFINDYKINLVEVAFLDQETIDMFQSDFREIAQFFVDLRKVKEGLQEKVEGSARKIRHVKAFFEAMKVLSGDGRFEMEYNRLHSEGKEANMQSVLEMLDEKTEARTEARDLKTLTQNLKKREPSLSEKEAEDLARSLLDLDRTSDNTIHKDSAG